MPVVASYTGDVFASGTLYVAAVTPRSRCITSDHMTNSPERLAYQQVPGTAVVAETKDIHTVLGATGVIKSIQAAVTGAVATGADRTVNVDLQRSTGAGAFATVLSATILFNNVSTLRQVVAGTLSGTALVAGDILRIVITVAGAAGNQAQGLIVTVKIEEVV